MTKYEPSTERPGKAFKRMNGAVVENDALAAWLKGAEREFDGAQFFDNDDAAVSAMYHHLTTQLRRMEFRISTENRIAAKRLLTRIYTDGDWHKWEDSLSVEFFLDNRLSGFDRTDIANIAIHREAAKKPHRLHEKLGGWISERGDLELFDYLYANGGLKWQNFALLKLTKAAERYFCGGLYRGEFEQIPENWPGQVIGRVARILNSKPGTADVASRADGLRRYMIDRQREAKAEAIRQAARPFIVP